MELLTTLSQVVIAASILIVWVFRFDNIVIEFNHFGLPDLIRSVVGAAKIAMATLLVLAHRDAISTTLTQSPVRQKYSGRRNESRILGISLLVSNTA